MPEIARLKRLKKDGSADGALYRPVIDSLCEGAAVIMPVDGVYGVAAVPKDDEPVPPVHKVPSEYLINEISVIESRARVSKREYDFLKRVWPDEVTVELDAKEGDFPLFARMPANPVNRAVIAGAGGILLFSTLLGKNGKPLSRKKDLNDLAEKCCDLVMVIDEWCKPHPLPTILDLRSEKILLVRKGKVSMDEILSLYFLGSAED
jgi:tRNA A37 threonylcarbamoyladenosine synthetase subunit TsaC/SUA5/YrdC